MNLENLGIVLRKVLEYLPHTFNPLENTVFNFIIITVQVFMYILVVTPRKYVHPLHFSATDNRKLIPVLGW